MIVDGNAIAADILRTVSQKAAELSRPPVLAIVTSAPNFETRKYLELKRKKANEAGIRTNIIELDADVSTDDVLDCVHVAARHSDGLILQLPFPPQVDIMRVLVAIPPTYDVDALNPETTDVLSPVVGACKEILDRYGVEIAKKSVTILGRGRLVGTPAEAWFKKAGAHVTVVTKEAGDMAKETAGADIIVCGTGVPGVLKPDMVKEGVVILDAGTSEQGGMLRGDALSACAERASLFTPVPGGIGPVTVAVLFRNLLALAQIR